MLQSYSFFSTLRVYASAFKRFLLIWVIHRRVWHPCHTHAARHTHAACHNQAFGVRLGPTNAIVRRTQSDRVADAIRSGGGRNLIGWRTQSDRVANASGDKSITYAHAKSNRKALIVIKIDHNTAEV